MKPRSIFYGRTVFYLVVATVFNVMCIKSSAQVSAVCTDPTNFIYGLTGSGAIYPINVNTGACGAATKNTTYSGNSPSSANGLGYNASNGIFYYFKRNNTSSPKEFVSFNPALNIVTILASCPLTNDIHTGCVSVTGTGYYTIDIMGNLAYYNISTNSWTVITSSFTDQFGNNVTTVIQNQNAGDITIDGWGNLWIVTSSATNFGVYRLQAPIPTTPVASLTLTRRLDPATPTPTGNMIAGIAFNPTGQIYLATKNDNRLYILENNMTTTFRGTFSVGDVGNDLTSCSFPLAVLPLVWKDFNAILKRNNQVDLTWEVVEYDTGRFHVETSPDGSNWKTIQTIESKNVMGADAAQLYNFTYTSPVTGRLHFRIRQTSNMGRETVSEIKSVMIHADKKEILVYPIPARENINIINEELEEGLAKEVALFDLSGKLLCRKILKKGDNSLSLQSVNKGIYILKILGSNQNIRTIKIVKQ